MARKIRVDSAQSTSRMIPLNETNGEAKPIQGESVANVINSSARPSNTPITKSTRETVDNMHQTHGAVFPYQGAVQSVSQLIGRTVAKGSVGSFDTAGEYKDYLNTLSLGELHRHAVEEAKIVPIDDRNRLIRRLEGEYTAIAARTPGRPIVQHNGPTPYTAEQTATLDALRKKLLRQ